jgi:hypothetical protein
MFIARQGGFVRRSETEFFLLSGAMQSAILGSAKITIPALFLMVAAPALARQVQVYPARPVFAADSFWYRPIPADAPLNPNSAAYVAEFLRQYHAYYQTVGINTTSYSAPVYVAGPETKAVTVAQWPCQNNRDANLAKQWTAVPIPSDIQPADGTDAEMVIYQPSTDSMWEFWRARQVEGQWQACWGGMMAGVSHNPGIWQRRYGVAATGLPFAAGQVTVKELREGVINHVIGIALVDADWWSIFSWPANRSDGYNPGKASNRIPEGLRFRLDPKIDIDELNISPIAKAVAKAGQKYGFVVWDKGGAISLRFENPKVYTLAGEPNPYIAIFNGIPSYAALKGIPWDRLQFLPMDYGKQ